MGERRRRQPARDAALVERDLARVHACEQLGRQKVHAPRQDAARGDHRGGEVGLLVYGAARHALRVEALPIGMLSEAGGASGTITLTFAEQRKVGLHARQLQVAVSTMPSFEVAT